MARYTTGEEIPPHLTSDRLPADHPLFRRGFMIGIRRSKTGATPSKPRSEELPGPLPGASPHAASPEEEN
jgi:hypothetical protein